MRPIGIGEVMSRITGRIIVDWIMQDLTSLGGNMQLCLGQKCGIEHAIHSLRHSFDDPENKAILLIDAKNALNVLNRRTALENVKALSPSLHVVLQNSYSHPSHLYISKSTILLSFGISWCYLKNSLNFYFESIDSIFKRKNVNVNKNAPTKNLLFHQEDIKFHGTGR